MPVFGSEVYDKYINMIIRFIKHLNAFIQVCQFYFLMSLFFHTIFQYNDVDYNNKASDHYIKKSIYRFTLIISLLMFIICVIAIPTILFLMFKDWGR